MSFLMPLFLLAAFALIFPIILHLIDKIRAVPQILPTLVFLKTKTKKGGGRKKINKILILILRILVFILLALLFAGPFFHSNTKNELTGRRILILIDNSLSMEQIYNGRSLLEQAKQKARMLYDKFSSTSTVFYTTLNPPLQRRWKISKGLGILQAISQTAISPFSLQAREIIRKINREFYKKLQKSTIIFITDMQRSFWRKGIKSTLPIVMIPIKNKIADNLFISFVKKNKQLLFRGKTFPMTMKINKTGNGQIPCFLKIYLDDSAVFERRYLIGEGGKTINVNIIPPKAGISRCRISISGDDFTSDNNYFRLLKIRNRVKIGVDRCTGKNTFIQTALRAAYGKYLKLSKVGDPGNDVNMVQPLCMSHDRFFESLKIGIPGVLIISKKSPINKIRDIFRRYELPLNVFYEKSKKNIQLEYAFPEQPIMLKLKASIPSSIILKKNGQGILSVLQGSNGETPGVLLKSGKMNISILLKDIFSSEGSFVFINEFPIFFNRLIFSTINKSSDFNQQLQPLELYLAKPFNTFSEKNMFGFYKIGKSISSVNPDVNESVINKKVSINHINKQVARNDTHIFGKDGQSDNNSFTQIQLLLVLLIIVLRLCEIRLEGRSIS